MILKRLSLLILLLGFFNYSGIGQTNCDLKLSGVIVEKNSGETIPLATIEVTHTQNGAIANENGEFEITNLCSGNYEILIRFVGYTPYKETISITKNTKIQVELVPEIKDLSEVTVEAEKAEEIATLKQLEFKKEELFRKSGESLGKTLSGMSGVNMLQTGPNIAKPVIHGLHSSRILILNNGIRQEGQQWGQEHAPEIDPFVATNLQLIKGAAAVKYGSDAIGGVILVNPPDLPETAGISGSFNAVGNSNNGMYTGSAMVEGGIEGLNGFGWRLQGSYKKAGDSKAPNYRLTNTGTLEKNFSIGLGYHKEKGGLELYFSSFDAEMGVLRSAHTGNLTDLERAIGSDRPLYISEFSYDINNPRQHVQHQLLKLNGHTDWSNLGTFNMQYGLQRNQRKEFDIRRGGRSSIPALSLELITHTVELDLDMKPIGDFKGDIGASFLFQGNSNDSETGIKPLIPNFDNWTVGVHGIWRYIQNSYELEAGVRYDYKHYLVKRFDSQNNLLKPEFDFNNITGSLGAVFFLPSGWNFRTNLGTAWRAPHINELYSGGLHHGSAAIEMGNENLLSEKAIKWISSFEKASENFDVNISAYYNYIYDYIYLRPENVELTIQGAFPLLSYTQTDASFIGLDTDLKYHINEHFDVTGKLSLIKAEDQLNNGPLINIPANRLSAGVTYNFNDGWLKEPYISLSADMVDKQRNAPRVVSISEVIEANATNSDLFTNDKTVFDFLAAPAGYTNFGFSVGFKVPVSENYIAVYASVENMFNNSYRDYMNRLRYYSDEVGRNFSIKLNYSF
ncbi:TonB-dependent receptor [Roseivirga seohaensis]|uniref:TonB-dependent receptor n=1 Tax=Roseivirga seohaensis TaxID=1914963 RepID=UPI003BA9D6A3